jgi:phosphoenolpyruvate carboxylase
VGFPGVYGFGSALERAADRVGIDVLRDMLQHWSFFRGLVNDVEMVLAKSVLDIGARYAALAGTDGARFHGLISAEFATATRMILEVKQNSELLADHHTLQRNIRLRNPYVDPLHLLQIDLLHRWRDGNREDDQLLKALKSTVNGIALAIQNTG